MPTIYDATLKANLDINEAGLVRGINYVDEYREMENLRGQDAAEAYVREIAGKLSIAPNMLMKLDQPVSYIDPREQGVEYRFSETKPGFNATTYGYYQTWLNTPVWGAGVTATIKQAPARVMAATNTSEHGIDAKMPSAEAIERYRKLFESAEKPPRGAGTRASEGVDSPAAANQLADILGKAAKGAKAAADQEAAPRLIRGRFFIYRYDAEKRTDEFPMAHRKEGAEEALTETHPSLPLPAVPKAIHDGHWYLVAELVFRLGATGNWRMMVEVESNAILYLRSLTSGVDGLVFAVDPITQTGNAANAPNATQATLNLRRSSVTLSNLTAPPIGANQALTGSRVQISDFELADIDPPTEAPGTNFNYQARTNNFAAVNAYYHCNRFFKMVEDLGFPLATYFDGTSFPVPVDHRGRYGSLDGIERNASCSGDGDGIANVDFELADLTDTANPMGIAADWRVVLHELGGHGIIYDHCGTANFGFSHSAGDSFAVILNDPATQATDRFESFPWVNFIGRRHDRTVAAGWGWGGTNDVGGYSSEQILATTHFRAYRSIGGDSTELWRREFAARCMAFLMLRAVHTLTPMSNPATPGAFLNALLTADNDDWTAEGKAGGAYGKVLTWAFEKQNLNGGAKPAVDVYIDDGRGGEYPYQPVHWATTTIWNRRHADDKLGHQEPKLNKKNYAYVKIKNRGTSVANNVIVKGFHCKPSAGVLWPNDFQAFTTPQLSAGTLQPNNAEEKIVGPFEWTPVVNTWGHDCMLMIVSATGDASNVDKLSGGEVFEDWRLVPNDNNVGQRNVVLAPGGGGGGGLMAGLHGKGFYVGNPGRSAATMAVSVSLPPLLASLGWRINVHGLPEGGARFKAREQRLVTFDVQAGETFSRDDVASAAERDIVVTATADGAVIGGMIYRLDPDIERPFNDLPTDDKTKCREEAKQLLECLAVPSDKVKCVRVRKISIDVEMDGGDCC